MIDLLPSDEQQQIVDSVSEFLSTAMPVSRLRPSASEAIDVLEKHWQAIAELGWFGLGLAEEHGGIGYSLLEEMLIAREFGRAVASPAMTAAMLAAHVAAQSANEELLGDIVSGAKRVGLANPLPNGDAHLIDARGAALVVLWSTDSIGLYAHGQFEEVRVVSSLDDAVLLERARAPRGAPLACVQEAPLRRHAALLVCAQLLGVAEAAQDSAVEYAKTREQFGQPIGAFQAIKHACADMAVQCEIAYSQTFFAGLTTQAGQADADFQCAAAARVSRTAALENARMNIQIHGGIGFTAECEAHHFLKRAHLLGQLGEGVCGLRQRLLEGAR